MADKPCRAYLWWRLTPFFWLPWMISCKRWLVCFSGFFEIKNKFAVFATLLQQSISGLLGKRSHVANRAWIGGDDAQHFSRSHARQCFLGFDDGQWAGQAGCVKLFVEFH